MRQDRTFKFLYNTILEDGRPVVIKSKTALANFAFMKKNKMLTFRTFVILYHKISNKIFCIASKTWTTGKRGKERIEASELNQL